MTATRTLNAAAPALLAECLRTQNELASAIRDGVSHFDEAMLLRWFRGVSEAVASAQEAA